MKTRRNLIVSGIVRWLLMVCYVLARWPGLAAASPHDPGAGRANDFFGPTNLYAFHLTIAPDQWAIMEELDQFKNAQRGPGNNGGRFPAAPSPRAGNQPGPEGNQPVSGIEFKKGKATLEFEGRTFGDIMVRFKGNSSFSFARNSLKRSLKLDFNDLDKDGAFFGLTKLNLNNNAMDPSQLREALAYHILRAGGVPAGRTAFARVFLTVPGKHDKAYAGLYTVVEQVDERFLKTRFGTKGGLLMKPERMPDLPYLGNDWTSYTNRVQPKSVATTNDASRFIEFVKCLNFADEARFQVAASEFMDVDEFLRFVALQALLSNMDSPLMTGHNYYLWLHPKTRRFVWIPWDLNEAFGGFNRAGTAAEQVDLSLDHPFTSVNRLTERLMGSPGIKDRYHEIVRGLLATNFSAARLFPVIDTMAATIRPALASDPMISLPQFEAALSTSDPSDTAGLTSAGGVDFRGGGGGMRRPRPALMPFITQRVDSARLQLEGNRNGYKPQELRPNLNGGPRRGGPPR